MHGERQESGFTLIEILVVVMILGLLISLAAPRLFSRVDDAKAIATQADIQALESALAMYKLDSDVFPTSAQGLYALVLEPTSGAIPRRYPEDGYLERVPTDQWGNDFIFASDGRSYVIRSLGADGEEGGDGVDADIDSRDF